MLEVRSKLLLVVLRKMKKVSKHVKNLDESDDDNYADVSEEEGKRLLTKKIWEFSWYGRWAQ